MAAGDMNSEFKAHEKSYGLFTWIIKWGAIISAVAVAFVVFLLAV